MNIVRLLVDLTRAHWQLILPCLLIVYLLSNRYQKGLHRVPGPWLNSVSTIPRIWSVYRGQHQLEDLRLHARYGKYVRLAPNLVSISDTKAINQLYGINTKFTKSPFYDLSSSYDDEGLVPDPFVIRKDKALHSRMKRNAANAYSMNGLVKFEPWIDQVVDRLLVILDKHAAAGTSCDLGDVVKRFAMDAVCNLTLGRDLSYMEHGDERGFFRVLDLFASYMSIFGHVAWLHPYLLGNPWIAGLFVNSDSSSQAMLDLVSQELQQSRENPPDEASPITFVGLLSLNQISNPKQINDREIVTHAFGNVSAGSDTTATAMRSIIYNLLKTPKAYRRLAAEVRGKLALPVTWARANELPYLRAVINEGLRIHPSVGQVLGRSVPEGGAVVGGYQLGAGAEVGMSPWVLQRDAEVFADPDSFTPERWLPELEGGSDEECLKRMTRSLFAFGHGTHTCSGKHISIMETTKLIATPLLKYDMELAEGSANYRFKNHWFTIQENLYVVLRPAY